MICESRTGTPDTPVVGVIGAGQLARMLYEAGIRLGCDVRVLASAPGGATSVARRVTVAHLEDTDAVRSFARGCDVVTFDHELVPPATLEALDGAGANVRPTPSSYLLASDKRTQRSLARRCGLRLAPARVASSAIEVADAAADLGLPVVAKRSRGGYDGRGVRWAATDPAVAETGRIVEDDHVPWIIEPELPIAAELAVVVARRSDGEVVTYPVTTTHQRAGTCRTVVAPALQPQALQDEVAAWARRIADELDHVGVLALEAFLVEGELVFNEIAPRPHNSGHYSIDACATSQFENHLRAVLDLPLGPAELLVPAAAMANVIAGATGLAPLRSVPVPPGASIHLYGKRPRPGRKVGHVTVCGAELHDALRTAIEVADQIAAPATDTIERVA